MMAIKTGKTNAAKLRQAKRTRRVFTDEYKANVLKTLTELIQNAPHKIGVFMKREGLTWSGVQQWKDQINKAGPVSDGAIPASEDLGNVLPELPELEKALSQVVPGTGGVRNMRVRRAKKYQNATLDRLYSENEQLKKRIAELEGTKKKVRLIVELQNKIFDVLEVGPK